MEKIVFTIYQDGFPMFVYDDEKKAEASLQFYQKNYPDYKWTIIPEYWDRE